jgi:hypothetical protein
MRRVNRERVETSLLDLHRRPTGNQQYVVEGEPYPVQ